MADKHNLQSTDKQICFTIDTTFIYTAFFADFGPLHLGHTFQFCGMLDNMFKLAGDKKKIIFYTSVHPHRRANGAALLLAYLVCETTTNSSELFHAYDMIDNNDI